MSRVSTTCALFSIIHTTPRFHFFLDHRPGKALFDSLFIAENGIQEASEEHSICTLTAV